MKSKRQPFDEGGSFVARKTFRFHGRTYARGAEFPWRQLSCSARKLFQLFDNGFLIPAGSDEQPPVEAQPAPDDSPEAKAARRKEAGRKAAEARKRNAEAKAAAAQEAPAPEAAGE